LLANAGDGGPLIRGECDERDFAEASLDPFDGIARTVPTITDGGEADRERVDGAVAHEREGVVTGDGVRDSELGYQTGRVLGELRRSTDRERAMLRRRFSTASGDGSSDTLPTVANICS
jgi:hypothetical protein